MSKKKKPTIEILPPSQTGLVPQPPAIKFEAILARMVRERVDEIMGRQDGAGISPDFQPKNVAVEMQRRQTVFERRKWGLYYERWGCRRCDTKKLIHAGNGYCQNCLSMLSHRLVKIKREYAQEHGQESAEEQAQEIVARVELAERLLGKGGATK